MSAAGHIWTTGSVSADASFINLAIAWAGDAEPEFVDLIWAGYERLKAINPEFDGRDLERSITQLLAAAIDDEVEGEAPYYVQHGPYERETMLAPPAQPPAYDLAFVMRANPRIMWPAEAKILTSANALADYLADVNDQYVKCRYAPFSPSGAMLGYLLDGDAAATLSNIATKLGIAFSDKNPIAAARPHRTSIHHRAVPSGKAYPSPFRCNHLVMGFHGLRRSSTA